MLKQILRTALVTAGVLAITPFAGAQGYIMAGRPMVMGRLGGAVVTPGVYSVFNPSAGFAQTMRTFTPPMRPILQNGSGFGGFIQPSPGNGVIMPTNTMPALPPMLPARPARTGFIQPSPGIGVIMPTGFSRGGFAGQAVGAVGGVRPLAVRGR